MRSLDMCFRRGEDGAQGIFRGGGLATAGLKKLGEVEGGAREPARAVEVTLQLSEQLVEHAQRFGAVTRREVGQVLADTLELMWATIGSVPEHAVPVSSLSDKDVLALADAKMDPAQNTRLEELQANGKEHGLTDTEQAELLVLLQMYQVGQLRKSEGLAEAVRPGLRARCPHESDL
jgi:hypothetical protein